LERRARDRIVWTYGSNLGALTRSSYYLSTASGNRLGCLELAKNVGVGAVQEAVAAKAVYDCDDILVVTNRRFTEPARKLARANRVTLWPRDQLVAKLLAVGGAQATADDTATTPAGATAAPVSASATAPPVATTVDAPSVVASTDVSEPARCVTCGGVVSAKVRDYCLARPARFGGRIYCYRHQRSAPALT
jgi:restriction system protein